MVIEDRGESTPPWRGVECSTEDKESYVKSEGWKKPAESWSS